MATCLKGVEFVKHITEIIAKSNGFESHLKKVKIVDGGDGKCTAEFKVDADHVNVYNCLHGGCIVTLVNTITTYALMSKPCHPGVSVDLSLNFLSGAKLGDDVIVEASLSKVGKYLAFLDCTLKHKNNDLVIANATHLKYIKFDS